MRKLMAVMVVGGLLLTAVGPALAGDRHAVSNRWAGAAIGAGVVVLGGLLLNALQAPAVSGATYAPPAVVYPPPPAVYAPPPPAVYAPPPPVVYAPPPVVYAPAPVVIHRAPVIVHRPVVVHRAPVVVHGHRAPRDWHGRSWTRGR